MVMHESFLKIEINKRYARSEIFRGSIALFKDMLEQVGDLLGGEKETGEGLLGNLQVEFLVIHFLLYIIK